MMENNKVTMRITRGAALYVDRNGVLHKGVSGAVDFSQVPMTLWLTFEGPVDGAHGMVVNASEISRALREALTWEVRVRHGGELLAWARGVMKDKFKDCKLLRLRLTLHEALELQQGAAEDIMQVTKKYELAASHRLAGPGWDEKRNAEVFGKCSNPQGHGHNYLLEVTLEGRVDEETGMVSGAELLDEVVEREILRRFDHKNLNADTGEFSGRLPTAENMAKVFWDKLLGKFGEGRLARLKVWETGHTYAEYQGEEG